MLNDCKATKENQTMTTHIYQTVTNRILAQLETGVIPWRKTWTTGLPKSLTSAKEYRGLNILVLGATQFGSRYWVTYREALRHGGHVRKGEKATFVVFWKWRTPDELKRIGEKTGITDLAPCYPFTSAVFNLDQVEGVARPEDDVPNRSNGSFKIAEQMLEVMPDKPEIVHQVAAEPAYSPCRDRITLPHLSQFESAAAYWETFYHELVHSTGARHRLNRFGEVEGDRFEQYSFEELVAEFGAAFLCAFTGISNATSEAMQASYIAGWSQALRRDNRLIVRAASAAQRAADYVRGKVVLEQPNAATPDLQSTEVHYA
jgi:antirestriction protein ArdC